MNNEFVEIDYTTVAFPPLPNLDEITLLNFLGPHPESNKVVEGIYAGAFPGDIDNSVNTIFLIDILNTGVTKFVCLQKEYNPRCPKFRWVKSGLRPYFEDVKNIIENKSNYDTLKIDTKDVYFEHLPIQDMAITDDHSIIALAKKLVRDYYNGTKMYIHCWGGHGRTGVLVCIMLHLMYGVTADKALEYCDLVHSMRKIVAYDVSEYTGKEYNVTSPQTFEQFKQVRRIINKLLFNKSIITAVKTELYKFFKYTRCFT